MSTIAGKPRQVHHPKFGLGTLIVDNGTTCIVRFPHGIEEVEATSLEIRLSLHEAVSSGIVASPLETMLRVEAASIQSVNDAWGVFSRSRIALLPHQLWVCHRALSQWPIRTLIADDVGLGKTIEAGLILWPLLARGVVRRLLILTPASLVEQWQYRLRTMFDIRLSMYRPEVDTPRADFWSTHHQVVASLPTLRADNKGRHDRLLEAPPWDMLIVDEAHHLNADEKTGKTLGFHLVEKLNDQQKIQSCVFFTGTPHRGKPYGFWSLMNLLRPDIFDPNQPESAQLPHLRDAVIRNAKQKVTDMKGKSLFKPIRQYPETYSYSPEEEHFYQLMTTFITTGKAYASGLSRKAQGRVMLVLIALQKLASSSVAAVRGALTTRLARLRGEAATYRRECDSDEQEESSDDIDQVLEKWIKADRKDRLLLMEDEIVHLDELLVAASAVIAETRIRRVVEVTRDRYKDEPVLLFTEYKATQALVVSALMTEYGRDAVGFINGDDRLDGVMRPDGKSISLTTRREETAEQFNAGRIRYLVSTEAGGEGIDLQERCHCLIHVDLPWNPMRLHQRVGRLNRYGQAHAVEVVSLRNPDTVESRIWSKLEEKLARIMQALGSAMDEPEDLLQLVLGMFGSGFFNEIFSEGSATPRERLDAWFDEKTSTFGGANALDTVKTLIGHCQSFDLSGLSDVPPKDLPDLLPFFQHMLVMNNRRPELDTGALTFKTPDAWLTTPGIRRKYEGLLFQRDVQGKDAATKIVGVGHQVFDQALRQAETFQGRLAGIPGLAAPIAVFRIRNRLTDQGGQVRESVVGVRILIKALRLELIRDWEMLDELSPLMRSSLREPRSIAADGPTMIQWLTRARDFVEKEIDKLGLPFKVPEIQPDILLWPVEGAL